MSDKIIKPSAPTVQELEDAADHLDADLQLGAPQTSYTYSYWRSRLGEWKEDQKDGKALS